MKHIFLDELVKVFVVIKWKIFFNAPLVKCDQYGRNVYFILKLKYPYI